VQYRVIIDHYRETASASLAPDLAAETYLDWASSLVQAGSFQDGIDRCQAVLVQYPDSKWIDQAAAAIPSFYFMWGDDLQHAGEYAEALERYEILLSEYPAAPVYSDTLLAVGQTYLDWGAELRSMRKFLDAMQKYTAAKDVLDDPEIISAAEDGYQGALWDLSQDSSGEGRLVLEEGIRVACSGEAAISPAIALDTESPGQARMCNEDFTLPQEMVAVKPASFRYAITTESGSSEIQNCPYTYQGCYGWSCPTTGTIIRQRLWVNVEVRDTLTGRVIYTQKFNGTNPEACPQTYYFWTTTEYFIGSEPDYADIIAWLEQVLR
jgi:tetratricopeptide (TPR) repeat protein